MLRLPLPLRTPESDPATPPAAPATPPAPPEAPKPADPPKAASGPTEAEILARVRAEYGGASAEQVKAALALAKAAEEAKKTDAENLATARAEAEAVKVRASALEAALKGHADRELASLTDTQRAAVVALAGDDPAKVIPAINTLRPTWLVESAPKAPPGNTAPPAGTAPTPGTPVPAVDHKAKLAALEANPYAHADYLARHRREIYPDL